MSGEASFVIDQADMETILPQSSCAFAAMANAPLDLTLAGAKTVVSFLAAHIANLQSEAAAATVAPLPNGDPFKYPPPSSLPKHS